MKVLILANNSVGLYKFRKELLSALLAQKNEVYISLPNGDFVSEMEQMGCRFIETEISRHGVNPVTDLKLLAKYVSVIKSVKPDIVFTYTIKPNVYGGLACQLCKVPYFANVTGLGTAIENRGVLSFISLSLYKLGLKKANCVFFQNKKNLKIFADKKIVCNNSKLIPGSGVNLDRFRPEPYPIGEKTIRFLFVGRMMKDKGIKELLVAVRKIHQKIENIVIDLVGVCEDEFKDEFQKIKNEPFICYHGYQSDVKPFYSRCHCIVLPSYHEGTANVLLEASAMARPVIATNIPGCQETFDEKITGFGCEVKNSDSLIKAMMNFLQLTQSEMKQMGEKAREKMVREFDRKIVINAYLEELAKI